MRRSVQLLFGKMNEQIGADVLVTAAAIRPPHGQEEAPRKTAARPHAVSQLPPTGQVNADNPPS